MVLRFFKKNAFLLGILALAFFLRIYRLPELMVFGGDVARDYLVARDMTLKGEIPLIGSPTSVPWLHQGAFFTYILGIVLWLGKYNSLSGGYFVGVMGTLGVGAVYLLGKRFFSEKAGLLSAFFYATSPLIIVFDRYPYHQSLISLFTMIFIYSLFLSAKKTNTFVLSSFLFGLLMQLELSNLVLLPILSILLFEFRKKIKFNILLFSFLAFVSTWIPKIIYDFRNSFTQTVGFIVWIIHKFPLISTLIGDQGIKKPLTESIVTIFRFVSRILFWPNAIASSILFVFLIWFLFRNFNFKKRKENLGRYLILLWLLVPILGFLVQGSPSESYVPIFFAPIALLFVGVTPTKTMLAELRWKLLIIFVILGVIFLGLFNSYLLLTNNFFIKTENKFIKREAYNLGISFKLNKEIAAFIVNDARGRKFNLISLGNYGNFSSSILNTAYLTWYLGNEPSEEKQNLQYFLYDPNDNINVKNASLIKDFKYIIIARKEKHD